MKTKRDFSQVEVERAVNKLRAIIAKNPEAREILREYLLDSTKRWK